MYSTTLYGWNHRILLDQVFVLLYKKIHTLIMLSDLHNNNNNFKYIITQLIEYSLYFAIYMYIAHFMCLPGCTLFQPHN